MRLGLILRVSFPLKKKIPGLKYHGVNQKTRPIKASYKYSAVNFLMMEEQNKSLLTRPYVTTTEEEMYGKDHPRKYEKFTAFRDRMRKPFYPDRTIEEHYLDTVYKLKKWE